MANTDDIGDDEILIRRVPPGETWQKLPGPVPTSVNVRLRPGETGLSASRLSRTSPRKLLALAGASPEAGWLVMAARAGDLRRFGLRIVPRRTPEDEGHVELEPEGLDLTDKRTCRSLVKLFTLMPIPPLDESDLQEGTGS